MKKTWLYILITLPLLLAFVPLFINSAEASSFPAGEQTAVSAPGPNAVPMQIGIYVLNVGNLDMTTGGYSMDFYLNLRCSQSCSPALDIMNATTAAEMEDQTGDHRGNTWYTYRVRADLVTDLNLRRFPFDDHQLSIEIEDKRLSTADAYFVVDNTLTGIDESAHVSGWLLKPGWGADVTEHAYPVFSEGEAYSRYHFYVTIYHPWFTSFMKTLFAAVVIVLVGMLSFFMQPSAAEERLALTSSTLVGSILYHLTITSTIPPVSYLTYADKFMVANYIVVSAAMAISVALMWFEDKEKKETAERLHKWTRIPVPLLWIIAMVVVTLVEFR